MSAESICPVPPGQIFAFYPMPERNELIQRCRNKDKRAEYELYRSCFSMLMRICIRYTRNQDDAAAVLNLGFCKILNNLNAYQDERSFDSWAKSIMINTIIDEFKSNKKRLTTMTPVDFNDEPGIIHPIDWNDAEAKLGLNELLTEIKKLPEPEQTVFNLFVFDGYSHKEIGQSLDMPESTSRWYLSTARKFLQKRISIMLATVKPVEV